MKKLNLAYFGSPDFSADFLKKLINDPAIQQLIEVNLVVTQEDKPVGRKQISTPTPVNSLATKYNLKIKNSLKNENLKSKISQTDLALIYAYGDLIPKELLTLPRYGFWNIHPSLLPKYRGSSPIAAPLINGDKTTGVTIIKMDEKIDHGPIIDQESLPIENSDQRPDLEKKLTDLAFKMFKKLIIGERAKFFATWGSDKPLITQDHKEATYTKRLSKNDGFIEFEKLKNYCQKPTPNSSLLIFNLFRGLYPWPGIWTLLPNGKRLKITDMELINGTLIIKKVQMEGKNEVDFKTFNQAYKIF